MEPSTASAKQGETFETRMASMMPGNIVFCGHRKTNLSILMRRFVEHLLDRPQTADAAEELMVEIYMPSPDPLWTSIMDGRGDDKRIRTYVSGIGDSVFEMSPYLDAQYNEPKKPSRHMIVVLDNVSPVCLTLHTVEFMMKYAADFNVTLLIRTDVPPSMPDGYFDGKITNSEGMETLAQVAVLAWNASPTVREKVWSVFGSSFGTKEDFEGHYKKMTEGDPAKGLTTAMIIEYNGSSNSAYNCVIPKVVGPIPGIAKRR